MTHHVVELGCLWATLVALAYLGVRDVIIPDVITLPAAFLGLALNYVRDPSNLLPVVAGILVGCLLPLGSDAVLAGGKSERRLGPGVMKAGGMLGAFLGWHLVLVALAVAAVLTTLMLRRMSIVPVALPLAIGGFLASLLW